MASHFSKNQQIDMLEQFILHRKSAKMQSEHSDRYAVRIVHSKFHIRISKLFITIFGNSVRLPIQEPSHRPLEPWRTSKGFSRSPSNIQWLIEMLVSAESRSKESCLTLQRGKSWKKIWNSGLTIWNWFTNWARTISIVELSLVRFFSSMTTMTLDGKTPFYGAMRRFSAYPRLLIVTIACTGTKGTLIAPLKLII